MKGEKILLLAGSLLLSACSTVVNMQKSYPPQYDLNYERKDFVFVNYFDYVLPEYIKDKNEVAYKNAVAGFADGVSSVFNKDRTASVHVADTMARGYTVSNMQTQSFADSIIALCKSYNANMLIAIDSLNIWFDWDTEVEENEDGSVSKTKNFYLYVRPYISLYASTGEIIDRCFIDRIELYKSRPTLSGLITIKPSLAKASREINIMSYNAGREFANKFYPSSEDIMVSLYTGKDFTFSNREVKLGNLGHAVDMLTPLTQSSNKNIARKASHNLSVVNEMIESKRSAMQNINKR
jgi:hypothetical protein